MTSTPRPSSRPGWSLRPTLGFALLLALTLVPLNRAQAQTQALRDVRLLSAGPGSIRLVVDVPAAVLEPLDGSVPQSVSQSVPPGATVVPMRLTVDGYNGVAPQGLPRLPERVIAVAVPSAGDVSVSGSSPEAEVTPDVTLELTPLTLQGRRDPPAPGEAEALTARMVAAGGTVRGGQAPLESGIRARLLEVGWMRNQRVAWIAITPADYDPARRRLALARRVDVEVRVGGAGPAEGAAPGGGAGAPDGFEPLYRATLVNYEQGRAWRRPAGSAVRPAFGPLRSARLMQPAGTVPDTSVYAGREWVKIAIDSSGFYKVRLAELRNLRLFGGSATTPISSLRLFTWPGIPVLPETTYCDSCDYREVALGFVEVTQNDTLDNNQEYIYFHALAASDWASVYDPSRPDTVFTNHPYETTNYYYLTISTSDLPVPGEPLRIELKSGAPSQAGVGAETPATFGARLHGEVDAQYWPNAWPNPGFNSNLFWEKWFWQNLEMGRAPFINTVAAPGVDVAQPSQLRMRLWGVTNLQLRKSFGIYDHYLDVSINGRAFGQRRWDGLWAQTYDTTLVGLVQPTNTLSMRVPDITDPNPTFDAERVDVTALAWYDLFYQRRFEPVADALEFESSPAGGDYLYRVGPFTLDPSTPPRVFDVTDPLAPIEILGGSYAGGILTFYRAELGRHRYRILPDARIELVAAGNTFMAPASSLNNLRRAPSPGQPGADFLVIYYDGFQAAAESLAVWRQARLPLYGSTGPYRTATVPISAVYDQFSGGRTDPGAIRNFLRAAFYNWPSPPTFVTLFGDASYDFKNIGGYAPSGLPGALIPAWEGGYVDFLASQFATDDWMLNVDNAVTRFPVPDFLGGRIPAGDAAGAMAFIRDKLLPYERSAPTGEWRNRVMLIADDNMQGARPDGIGWLHLRQTATLDTDVTPPHIDREYVYLHTYPTQNESKPLARAAIIENVNNGVMMWNYIGHGSPFKIADENALLTSDVGSLHNATMPGLFVAASCDVGKFHDPSVQSLGELLVMSPTGGAIAVVSATELAFSTENALLNRTLYREIFTRDTAVVGGGVYYETVAEALLAAKNGSQNGQKYQIMGDAATRLLLPRMWVEVTLRDSAGTPIDTLRRGQLVSFEGRVLDRPGGTPVPFSGSTAVLIEDSAPIESTPPECEVCVPTSYPFRAAPMFRGDTRVLSGTFSGRFVVPLDAVVGARGRARSYVSGEAAGIATSTDGAGHDRFTVASGTAPPGDTEGPRIGLSFAGGSTSVRPDATLRIDLTDQHGILITGHTIQNGIIVTIDGNSNTRVDVTPSFRYAANSYQAGTASFHLDHPGLPALATGPHVIRVSAADNLATGINAAQHRTSATIEFQVSEDPPLTVQRAYLFPNPTRSGGPRSGGQFVIDAPGDSVNALVNLYTVSGRLIRTLKAFGGQGQIQIPWDGLDAEGDPLANGTYLFMVQLNTREADGSSSARSRAVGEGRVVVVGH